MLNETQTSKCLNETTVKKELKKTLSEVCSRRKFFKKINARISIAPVYSPLSTASVQ